MEPFAADLVEDRPQISFTVFWQWLTVLRSTEDIRVLRWTLLHT